MLHHILNVFHQQARTLSGSDVIGDGNDLSLFDPLALIYRFIRFPNRIFYLKSTVLPSRFITFMSPPHCSGADLSQPPSPCSSFPVRSFFFSFSLSRSCILPQKTPEEVRSFLLRSRLSILFTILTKSPLPVYKIMYVIFHHSVYTNYILCLYL